ncbi:nucleotidyltransferase predicted [Firmicutes bacterium CAG:449]|nr:nucleotidyltransferase predicted [Firmicutes bacterium CAG:449]
MDSQQQEFINMLIENIEKKNNIKILFAAEDSYQRFKFLNKKNDYDIKFVYISNNADQEIDLEKQNELFNVHGYELHYVLENLMNGDYKIVELLNSTSIYFKCEKYDEIKKVIYDAINIECFERYLCKKINLSFKKEIENKKDVVVTSYLSLMGDYLLLKYCLEIKSIQSDIYHNIQNLPIKLTSFMDILYLMDKFNEMETIKTIPYNESLNKIALNCSTWNLKKLKNVEEIKADDINKIYKKIIELYPSYQLNN